MIDVRRLAVLRELHRCGTVTAAAAALHLTPSAVSQHLAALSRETRTRLVEPHGRRIRLTGAGLVLLQHAETVLAELERTEAVVGSFASGGAGVTSVGAFPTAINALVVPAMARLRSERPAVRVNVSDHAGDAAVQALMRGEVDIAIWLVYPGSRAAEERGAVGEPLLEDLMDVVLPVGHSRAGDSVVDLHELRDEGWVAGLPDSPCRKITEAACAANGFAPRVEHCTDDWTAVVGLVGAGAGVALVPRLARPVPPEAVVVRPVAREAPRRKLQLLVRPAGTVTPHVTAVMDAIRAVAADVSRGMTHDAGAGDPALALAGATG
jgi:DNA-binding transcriptional LysR family regulator